MGSIIEGEIPDNYLGKVLATIDHARRADIKRNHTATHLLHKALRTVLGEHVHQAGSLVAPDRLRFDFTHFKAMTLEEIDRVEDIVNEKIQENLPVHTPENDDTLKNLTLEKAKEMGAMALFGEKYGDIVRVVKTGDFSLELCGGTHVNHTAEIGKFFISQETAIAAGMRRIEALTGTGAERFLAEQGKAVADIKNYMQKKIETLSQDDISAFKNLVSTAVHRRILQKEHLAGPVEGFLSNIDGHLHEKEKESAGKLAGKAASLEPKAMLSGDRILIFVVPADSAKELMVYSDSFRKLYSKSAVVTISKKAGNFAITSSDDGLGKQLFKTLVEITGARGGGQPTIRGTMPVEKIDSFIEELKRKFG
jgi:alanyl-tRNA synthetase